MYMSRFNFNLDLAGQDHILSPPPYADLMYLNYDIHLDLDLVGQGYIFPIVYYVSLSHNSDIIPQN